MIRVDLNDLSSFISTYGLPGLFIVIFFANLIPVAGLSFAISTSFFSIASSGSSLSPSIILGPLVIASAATTAKFIIFSASHRISQRFHLAREKRRELAEVLKGKEHVIMVVTMITALTPLPDDALYIPLGVSGFNLILFVVSVFVGKAIQACLALAIGISLGSYLANGSSIDLWKAVLGVVFTIALVSTSTYITMKVDWIRFMVICAKKGLVEAVKDVFYQLINK